MATGESLRTSHLLERMPPIERAPLLEKLGSLSLESFRNEYAIETPVDPDTGIVDHDALVAAVTNLVSPDYKWKAPFFDEHHVHWYARSYEEHPENPQLASNFRNLPIHKLWVPRQFHDFTHVVMLPPPVPSLEAMRYSVKEFRRKQYLFRIATGAIELREKTNRLRRYETPGRTLFIDPATRRSTEDEASYETRRQDFIHYIEQHHRRGLIDLSDLSPVDLRGAKDFESILPEIQQFAAAGIMRAKGIRARRVDLAIDRAA